MKIEQEIRTIIRADEGKLIVRKSDGQVVGDQDNPVHLGYDYYDAGVALRNPRLMKPDDYEEIDRPKDYEVKPIINQEKRLARITELLNREKQDFKTLGLSAEQMLTHKAFAPKWGEDIKVGDTVVKGDKFTYEGRLYAVLQDHTILPHYYPSINTAALYVEVTPDYTEEDEEYGTLENPIPYNGNMILEKDKYYLQDDIIYLCNRDSINPIYHNLNDLLGLYVEKV